MPKNPAAMSTMPVRITGREPRSSASLPNRTAPTAQPSIATMYGSVAAARDSPNSRSIGGRNRLNVLMPMEVIVTTTVQSSRIVARERFIAVEFASPAGPKQGRVKPYRRGTKELLGITPRMRQSRALSPLQRLVAYDGRIAQRLGRTADELRSNKF